MLATIITLIVVIAVLLLVGILAIYNINRIRREEGKEDLALFTFLSKFPWSGILKWVGGGAVVVGVFYICLLWLASDTGTSPSTASHEAKKPWGEIQPSEVITVLPGSWISLKPIPENHEFRFFAEDGCVQIRHKDWAEDEFSAPCSKDFIPHETEVTFKEVFRDPSFVARADRSIRKDDSVTLIVKTRPLR